MQPPAASKNFSTPPSAAAPHICLLPRLFRLLLLLCLLLVPSSIHNVHGRPHDQQHPFAQGNLFIVFHPRTGRSSEHSPQLANLSSLWCQATSNGNDRLRIKKADFVRVLPKPEKIIPASRYNGARDRAFLDFGLVPITSIGKYRCEIQTQDGDFVTGNLFVYMRPILLLNSTQRLDPVEEGNSFAWIGQTSKASEGDDAVLNCPAIGYPLPEIRWYKDGKPINTSAIMASNDDSSDGFDSVSERRKYLLTAQSLYIREVNDADEGTYKCVATNEFPLHAKSTNDEKSREFYLSLEQHLRITNSLSWLLPLLIILAGLLLLVIIIWGCSQWKRYKYDQYNVAQKEKELGKKDGVMDGQQKMPLEPDDVED